MIVRLKRLKELAKAASGGRVELLQEFSMRVPAEPDRDADLVLSWAVKVIEALEQYKVDFDSASIDAEFNSRSKVFDVLEGKNVE